MKTGLLFVLLSALVLSGCRSQSRVNQQLLERELRLQEDCIWRLKWALEDQQRVINEARQQAETYKKEADALRGKASTGPDLSPPSSILAPAEGGGRDTEAPRLPPAPTIERGTEVDPRSLMPPSGAGSSNGGGSGRGNPPRSRSESTGPALTQASAISPEIPVQRPIDSSRTAERLNPDLTIDRIVLNEKMSGGLNLDGKPGDELLSVAIEQRDAKDTRIIAPGDVSIVVVDPALEGRAAKIARWDFDAEEDAKCVRRNRDGAAMQFELPWPKQPEHGDLRLFVRFTTYDGRKLEANLPIEVQLAGGSWTKSRVALAAHEENVPEAPTSADDAPSSEPPPADRPSKWSPNR
jgi:hypothetical protein